MRTFNDWTCRIRLFCTLWREENGMAAMNQAQYDRIEHPKTCAPDDFWGQVRRTVNGKPLPQEQLDLIFSMIRQALCFKPEDVLLDLCCGNGRLGFEFFDEVHSYLGVDVSPSLIEIAQKNFQRLPTRRFALNDIHSYLNHEHDPTIFTKVMWYSSCPYFTDADLKAVLSTLHERFTAVRRLFLGSLPDAPRAHNFFREGEELPLDDHTSCIGRWFERAALQKMTADCGWNAEIKDMPNNFYQATYRFNALLTRRS